MQIIREIQDLTYLDWTRTRHSSGTAGSFLKAYEVRRGRRYYYKLSNYDVVQGIVGHECVNEIVVDRLLNRLGISHLSYQLIHARITIKGRDYETWLCQSADFKIQGDSKIALDAWYDAEADGESPLEFCYRRGFSKEIDQMLLTDFLILNRDRHGANIEILKNRKNKTYRMAPLFDHGLSLLFSCHTQEAMEAVEPAEDKQVQSFVGSHSTYENLKLISREGLMELPAFDHELYRYLFDGMEEIMGAVWVECTWNFLKKRAEIYEDFRNQRC